MSREDKTISLNTFNEMKESFNDTIKPVLGEQNSNSGWYTLSDLKEYIAFIESEAAKNNIDYRQHIQAPVYRGNKRRNFRNRPGKENPSLSAARLFHTGSRGRKKDGRIIQKPGICPCLRLYPGIYDYGRGI